MRYIVSDNMMKALERYTIDYIQVPSLVLMEKAALAVRDAVIGLAKTDSKILVVCGTGNNGADGLAVVRLLREKGFVCDYAIVGNVTKATKEWQLQHDILERLYGMESVTMEKFGEYNVLVDAIFGIGLSRNVEGEHARYIEAINNARRLNVAKVVAIDVPSGINATTAEIMNTAVYADITVTFGFEKIGLRMFPGNEYAGNVMIADIGIGVIEASGIIPEIYTHTLDDYMFLPARRKHSNKGSYGKVLIIAGAKNMAGAAIFSALTAYRMGAGLVYIITDKANRKIIQSKLPEAVLIDTDSGLSEESVLKYAKGMDSIVCGPGLGTSKEAEAIVRTVLKIKDRPVILDADALNIIAKEKLCPELSDNMVLTPHLGEMARLTGLSITDIQKDMINVATEFAKNTNIILVLKDAVTVIADKKGVFYLNSSGNSGMSTAGSGDVLTGVIGALMAMYGRCSSGKDYYRLGASLGVYIHGLAGDYAKRKLGERPLLSRDICKSVEKIMGEEEWKRLF